MTDESLLTSTIDDIEATSLKYMLKLISPAAVTTVSFTLMMFVDQYMVSRLGTNELAAIGAVGFVTFLPRGFAMGTMGSLSVFVSQSLGRGELKECSKYFWQAVFMGFVYSVAVIAVMWPAAPWIFKLMDQPEPIAQMEVVYLRIMLCTHLLAVVNWAANPFFMGAHRPIIMMWSSLAGQIVNVAANYVLIFGKFGLPAMGIAGAAWGTFIGITVAAVVNLTILLGPRINKTFATRHGMAVNLDKMYGLLKVGLPVGLGLSINVALWGMILFTLVGKFGKEGQAATTAVFNWTRFSVMPVVGIGMALGAAVGKSIGAGKKELAAKQTAVCLRVGLLFMGLAGLCFFLFREQLMAFWTKDQKVVDAGTGILICAAVYQLFHATRIIYGGALQGAGDTLWLMMISSAGTVVILAIGGTAMILLFPGLGALGPWIAASVSIAAAGAANRWRFKSNRWKKIDLFKHQAPIATVQDEGMIE